ncbi:DUF6290 family protein [Nesterenkonia ebinurensis]|uniref:DUF6290 family protein n=1 Tax=Nesterenkonia ebinurensis TaxID=2608252 RepID=UPI00123D5C55|nr:DUF6290 family protein [Nesterenkonia ebinurensis]
MSKVLDFDPETDALFDKFAELTNMTKAEAVRKVAAAHINEELYVAEVNAEYDAYLRGDVRAVPAEELYAELGLDED